MKVTGSTIQQLEKDKPKSKCRKWRLWATTDQGRKSERFTGTYTKAQERLKAWVAELEETVPNSETFGAYAESWASWREKSGDLSPNTVAKDARNVTALRRTALYGMRMDSIGPEQCREALLWLKANPAKGSGELSGTTLRTIYVALNSIMQQAEDDGRVASNPCAKVKPPKEDTREREALSPGEIALLMNRLDEMVPDAHVVAVYLMACLGLRRGESLALMDADVSGGVARVRLSVKEGDGTLGPPKSPAAVRTLPVPARLQGKVDQWRALRRRMGLFGETLCCNSEGGVMRPQNLYKWWRRESTSLGCEGITLHQLRHSNLSMMARHMSPFDLQRYAGWSSIEPAMVYVHDDMDAVSRAVAEAWGGLERTKNAPGGRKGQGVTP